MFVVIGLGNPGSEYAETRHNIGFVVIDAVCHELGIRLTKSKGEYILGTKILRRGSMALVKPLTYMNNSGVAVKEIIDKFNAPLENLLIVSDDFNIPIGTIRIRRYGSSGGHNGLASIIYHLQSENFPRLRCGIASESMPKRKQELADFVLSPFTDSEKKIIQRQILNARDAILYEYSEGLEATMHRFNNLKI